MPDEKEPVRVYDYIPDPVPSNPKHLPFPAEGDKIRVGDDMGEVVECSFAPLRKKEVDDQYARYVELKILIRI